MAYPFVKIGPYVDDTSPFLSAANENLRDQALYDAHKFGIIADTILGSDTASFDFTSISALWSHLRVVAYLRGSAALTASVVNMRLNNDSGANYSSQFLTSSGATTTSAEEVAQQSIRLGRCTANSGPANAFSTLTVDIGHYSQATNHKTVSADSGAREGTGAGGITIERNYGVWFATPAAINRITILPATGNFKTGSRCTIYGLGRP
jgi:hypothetical protein